MLLGGRGVSKIQLFRHFYMHQDITIVAYIFFRTICIARGSITILLHSCTSGIDVSAFCKMQFTHVYETRVRSETALIQNQFDRWAEQLDYSSHAMAPRQPSRRSLLGQRQQAAQLPPHCSSTCHDRIIIVTTIGSAMWVAWRACVQPLLTFRVPLQDVNFRAERAPIGG